MNMCIYESDENSDIKIKIGIHRDNNGIVALDSMSINGRPNMLLPDGRYSDINIMHNDTNIKLPHGGKCNKNFYKRYCLENGVNYIFVFESKNNYDIAKVYQYKDKINIDAEKPIATIKIIYEWDSI